MWFLSGRLEESAAVTLDSMAMGEALGGVRLNAAVLNSAGSLLLLGRWSEAEALVRDVELVSGNCGLHREMFLAEMALHRGQFEAAKDYLAIVDERSKGLEDVQFRGDYFLLRAALALEEERAVDVCEDVEHALALLPPPRTRSTHPRCACWVCRPWLIGSRRIGPWRAPSDADTLRESAAVLAAKADAAALPRELGRTGLPAAHGTGTHMPGRESRLPRIGSLPVASGGPGLGRPVAAV